ncbi:hypothetical protein [Clostridium sp.]|jgi:hypothetical protein|uniref:HTH-like domain-containing protein n=1 Tax=Clostridium sp. TaxID=1506 RepID=UPI003A20098D
MTVVELGCKLREMYEIKGANKTTMIHLFGTIYAEEIKAAGTTPAAVIKAAEMQPSYATEVNKGMNLAKYLKLKPEYEGKF